MDDDDVVGQPYLTTPTTTSLRSLEEVVGDLKTICQMGNISASLTFFSEDQDGVKVGIHSWHDKHGSSKIRDRIELLQQLSQVENIRIVGAVGTDLFDGDDGTDDDTTEGGEG